MVVPHRALRPWSGMERALARRRRRGRRRVERWLDGEAPAELCSSSPAGPGSSRGVLAPKVGRLTAIDASPEVLAINRGRVAGGNVEYVASGSVRVAAARALRCRVLQLLAVACSRRALRARSGRWLATALAPGGAAYLIDSAFDPTSTAKDHVLPERDAGIVTRRLNDGREFRIVKLFYEPAALAAKLERVGFAPKIRQTARYFIYGEARPAAELNLEVLLVRVDVRRLRHAALVHPALLGELARRLVPPDRARLALLLQRDRASLSSARA